MRVTARSVRVIILFSFRLLTGCGAQNVFAAYLDKATAV